MPLAGDHSPAVLGDDGLIYVVGGRTGQLQRYDPATDVWTVMSSLPTARGWLAAEAPGDGKLYTIGGFVPGSPFPWTWVATNEALVLIDKTAPYLDPSASPPANGAGWNNADVTVTWTCTDAESGVDLANSDLAADVLTVSGTATATCVDLAGNVTTGSRTVAIDKTAPTLDPGASPPANGAGWNNADVTVTWTCTDAESGVDHANSDLAADVLAASGTATATCVDLAGNVTTGSYSVLIDKVAPTISVSMPVAGGLYGLGYALTPAFTCADPGGSGIASCTSTSAPTSAIGPASIAVTAIDVAGNVTTVVVTYEVGGKDQCRQVGWQRFLAPVFTNQGQCISHFN